VEKLFVRERAEIFALPCSADCRDFQRILKPGADIRVATRQITANPAERKISQ
jgi:hypothetical protein